MRRSGVLFVCTALVAVFGHVGSAATEEPPRSGRRDVSFRESLGLRADIAYVDDLQRAWDGGQREGLTVGLGIPMTDAEFHEVSLRQGVAADDAPIVRAYVNQLGAAVYGGLFLDNGRGGLLTVRVTRDVDAIRDALATRVKNPDRLRVLPAKTSLAELTTIKDAIFDRRDTLAAEGVAVTTTAVDEPGNGIVVGVASNVVAAQERFNREYGPGVVVVKQQSVGTVGTTYPHAPPFKGGLKTETPGPPGSGVVYTCTSGFVAYRNALPRMFYLLSAGHCGPNGSVFTQGFAVTVGAVDRTDFHGNSRADTLRIPISHGTESNRTVIHYSPTLAQGQYKSMTKFQGQGADVVGTVSCHSGYNWVTMKCGTILATSYDYSLSAWYGTVGVFRHGRELDVDCLGGDSGGSVWYASEARGLMSARITRPIGRDTCIYGHVYDNLRGVDLDGIVTTFSGPSGYVGGAVADAAGRDVG